MRNLWYVVGACALAGCGSQAAKVSSDQASSAAALSVDPSQSYSIVGQGSGLVVEVYDSSTAQGARIQQWTWWGGPTQQWHLVAQGGAYEIVNNNSGQCLDVQNGSTADGATVQQWGCWAGPMQLWTLQDAGGGAVSLVNSATGKCLDVLNNSSSPGATVQQWTCWGGTNQHFTLTPQGTSSSSGSGSTATTSDQATYIRSVMQTVLDTPHSLADGEVRGSPGSFESLGDGVVAEYVASIADCAALYLPPSLSFNDKVALLVADINAESSFRPGTSAPNGADSSVGPQQVTPGIWVPQFQNHASGTGLYFYDGTPWAPSATTTSEMISSIWDNMHVANWAIGIQGQNGGQDANAGPGGPLPRTWWTGLYCWVSGYPAADSGGDVAQSSHYRAMQEADLTLLGLSTSLLDSSF